MYLTAILKQKEEFDDLAPWVGALLLEDRFYRPIRKAITMPPNS